MDTMSWEDYITTDFEKKIKSRRRRSAWLPNVRQLLNKNLQKLFTSQRLASVCVEEIIMLLEITRKMMLIRQDALKMRKTTTIKTKLEEERKKEKEWRKKIVQHAGNVTSPSELRLFIFNVFLTGLSAICNMPNDEQKLILFKNYKKGKKQKNFGMVNIFITAIIEAYNTRHKQDTGESIIDVLKPLEGNASLFLQRQIRRTQEVQEVINNLEQNCRTLINLLIKYKSDGIELTEECRTIV